MYPMGDIYRMPCCVILQLAAVLVSPVKPNGEVTVSAGCLLQENNAAARLNCCRWRSAAMHKRQNVFTVSNLHEAGG